MLLDSKFLNEIYSRKINLIFGFIKINEYKSIKDAKKIIPIKLPILQLMKSSQSQYEL